MKTGFKKLDEIIKLKKSNLIVIASRPAMGKSAFGLNIVENVSIRQKKPTLIFSLDMSKNQIVNRILSSESMIEANKIINKGLNDEEWNKITKTMKEISQSNIFINDTPAISIEKIEEISREQKSKNNIALILIDYIQLVKIESENTSREEINIRLKKLSIELKIPIIILSELSRKVTEDIQDERPAVMDFRRSSVLGQNADVVMYIYKESYFNSKSKDNTAKIIVSKNEYGNIGSVDFLWKEDYLKFEEM